MDTFGDNINSAVLSFVERLSFSRRFKLYWKYREANFWNLGLCRLLRGILYCIPISGGSTIKGSTAQDSLRLAIYLMYLSYIAYI